VNDVVRLIVSEIYYKLSYIPQYPWHASISVEFRGNRILVWHEILQAVELVGVGSVLLAVHLLEC